MSLIGTGRGRSSDEGRPLRLNIGCGRQILGGWTNIDRDAGEGVDLVWNVERWPLPFEEQSVDEFLLSHVLEHISDPLRLMEECHRRAKPGAPMTVRVPHGANDDAWADPTHVRPYFVRSFGYFGQPHYWRADYGYRGDWFCETVKLLVDGQKYDGMPDAGVFEAVQSRRNVVLEMVAILRAVHPIREPKQELQKPQHIEIVRVGKGET